MKQKLSVKALALTGAIIWGGGVFFVGLANMLWPNYAAVFLEVVASIYPGYQAGTGFGSVAVAALWALADGAGGGMLLAWLYNLLAT